MKLKSTNILLFFYKIYTVDYETKPNSLCPLFWGALLGFLSLVLCSPIHLILYAISLFGEKSYFELKKSLDLNGLWMIIGFSITSVLLLMTSGFIMEQSGIENFTDAPFKVISYTAISLILPVVGLILFFVILGVIFSPNAFYASIHTIYKRYCPLVSWDENEWQDLEKEAEEESYKEKIETLKQTISIEIEMFDWIDDEKSYELAEEFIDKILKMNE